MEIQILACDERQEVIVGTPERDPLHVYLVEYLKGFDGSEGDTDVSVNHTVLRHKALYCIMNSDTPLTGTGDVWIAVRNKKK